MNKEEQIKNLCQKNIFINLDYLSYKIRQIKKQIQKKQKEWRQTNDQILKDEIFELQKQEEQLERDVETAISENTYALSLIKNKYPNVFDSLLEDKYLSKILKRNKFLFRLNIFSKSAFDVEKLYQNTKQLISDISKVLEEFQYKNLSKEDLLTLSNRLGFTLENKEEMRLYLIDLKKKLEDNLDAIESSPFKLHKKLIDIASEIVLLEKTLSSKQIKTNENETHLLFNEEKQELETLKREIEKRREELKNYLLLNIESLIFILKNPMLREFFERKISKDEDVEKIIRAAIPNTDKDEDITTFFSLDSYSKDVFFKDLEQYDKVMGENNDN